MSSICRYVNEIDKDIKDKKEKIRSNVIERLEIILDTVKNCDEIISAESLLTGEDGSEWKIDISIKLRLYEQVIKTTKITDKIK